MDSLELFLALAFASLATVGALGFILFQQPVHAALSFAVTVLSGAGLYLLLDAPYAAVATVIVYAGATIIIFLFALMFAQRSTLQIYDEKKANPLSSVIASAALIAILAYAALSFSGVESKDEAPSVTDVAVAADSAVDTTLPVASISRLGASPGSDAVTVASAKTANPKIESEQSTGVAVQRVADLGRVIYTRYLWAIELAGAILLVATLGAIQIARDDLTPNLPAESPSP